MNDDKGKESGHVHSSTERETQWTERRHCHQCFTAALLFYLLASWRSARESSKLLCHANKKGKTKVQCIIAMISFSCTLLLVNYYFRCYTTAQDARNRQ